jgi:hypothetical protein
MSEIQVANVWLSTGKTYGVLGSTSDVVTIRTGSADRLLTNTTALSVNTTLSIVGNTTFSGGLQTISGNVNIDSGALFVDGTNNRVGVNTTTPDAALQVVGTANVSGVTRFAANVTVATNTFTLGTSSAAANGYTYLPNGLIMQWGTFVCNTISQPVFSIAFPTAVVSIQAIGRTTLHRGANNITIGTVNLANAQILSVSTSTTANAYYLAIGY